jgi:hypothetical protein
VLGPYLLPPQPRKNETKVAANNRPKWKENAFLQPKSRSLKYPHLDIDPYLSCPNPNPSPSPRSLRTNHTSNPMAKPQTHPHSAPLPPLLRPFQHNSGRRPRPTQEPMPTPKIPPAPQPKPQQPPVSHVNRTSHSGLPPIPLLPPPLSRSLISC